MTKKTIFFLIIFFLIASSITGGVLWYANEVQKETETVQRQTQEQQRIQQQQEEEKKKEEAKEIEKKDEEARNKQYITDVDPDVSHWQTKEGKAFTIKFPKEWYWMESSHGEHEGYAEIITNNPNFDIEKYAEIGIGGGINYPLVFKNDTEIIISFGGVSVTYEVGTPKESINWQIEWIQKYVNSQADCSRVDSGVFPMAYCTFVDTEKQKIQVYFVAEKSVTYAFTARTTENILVKKEILDKIVNSVVFYKYMQEKRD